MGAVGDRESSVLKSQQSQQGNAAGLPLLHCNANALALHNTLCTLCTTLYAQDTQNAYKAHSEDMYYSNMPDIKNNSNTVLATPWPTYS